MKEADEEFDKAKYLICEQQFHFLYNTSSKMKRDLVLIRIATNMTVNFLYLKNLQIGFVSFQETTNYFQ